MSTPASTTIVAIASPPGGGERGVIRVSGPEARRIVRAVWSGMEPDLRSRGLFRGRFRDARGSQPLLLLWMPAPHSFTREDVAEFHLPGSPPLLAAALARLLALGAIPARPGEFTRRAFESGRIDLTRAEGVLALIQAHDESEARAARALLFGGLGQRVSGLRDTLEDLRALCEASLDFDERDTGHVSTQEIAAQALAIDQDLSRAIEFERSRATRTGLPRVCFVGAPNAGKSSLFNALARSDRAIVTDQPGTTRDALVAQIELDGCALELVDTAGLDAPSAGPDHTAQDVARGARDAAELLVWVVDAARADEEHLRAEQRVLAGRVPRILAWNKTDLAPGNPPAWLAELAPAATVAVCARTQAGLLDLRRAIGEALERASLAGGGERGLSLRHLQGLEAARRELGLARASLSAELSLELVAEHLQEATRALDQLDGTTTPEHILDRIFSRFCLGK